MKDRMSLTSASSRGVTGSESQTLGEVMFQTRLNDWIRFWGPQLARGTRPRSLERKLSSNLGAGSQGPRNQGTRAVARVIESGDKVDNARSGVRQRDSVGVSLAILVLVTGMPILAASTENASRQSDSSQYWCFVGTYTQSSDSEGIYVFSFDVTTGDAGPVQLAARGTNPSFLAIHPAQDLLYAVSEVAEYADRKSGAVSAFTIDRRTGMLKSINQQSSVGTGPCHLVVDRQGSNVLVANYGGGSVACLPIAADGRLKPASAFVQHHGSSVNPRRQQAPHAHSINLDPNNRYAIVADLGLDQLRVYQFNSSQGTLTQHTPASSAVAPGAGPRHFTFHPHGQYAYVINELDMTVTTFAYDAPRGVLTAIQTTPTLPAGVEGEAFSTAEIRAHPSGKFLYGSNRGHNSIVVYRIDDQTGKLSRVENQSTHGKTPRNFFIDPTGVFLLAENQASNNIVLFRIDQQTGKLSPTGNVAEVPRPVCVRMVPVAK